MSDFPRVTADDLERAALRGWVNPDAVSGLHALMLPSWQVDQFGPAAITESCRRLGLSWQEVPVT